MSFFLINLQLKSNIIKNNLRVVSRNITTLISKKIHAVSLLFLPTVHRSSLQLFYILKTKASARSEQQKMKKRQKRQRDSEAKTEGRGTQILFNRQEEEQRLKTRQRNKQTGMQEASDRFYSAEQKQAGETEKQEYIHLKTNIKIKKGKLI